jgi:hypothetical protein
MLTTNQKGVIAETAVIHEAARLGIDVWVPLSGHGRSDLTLDDGSRLLRIQCKTAMRFGDVLMVRLYSTRRSPAGLLKRAYSAKDADAFAVYSPTQGCCYLLEMLEFAGQTQASLRLGGTLNNQASGVRWARDYEFAARLNALLGP